MNPSVMEAPPVSPMRHAIGLVVFALILGLAVWNFWPREPPDAYVECVGTGLGYRCSVTHKAGSGIVKACWTLQITCRNDAIATAGACQNVQPESKATTLISLEDIHNARACDELKAVAVTNVSARYK